MIILDPPWKVATPIGDAEARILDPGAPDDKSRFLCVIEDSGETWWLSQLDIRVNTNITEGRNKLTPFSAEAMERFRPMREAIAKLYSVAPSRRLKARPRKRRTGQGRKAR